MNRPHNWTAVIPSANAILEEIRELLLPDEIPAEIEIRDDLSGASCEIIIRRIELDDGEPGGEREVIVRATATFAWEAAERALAMLRGRGRGGS